MDSTERWQEVKNILYPALEMEPAERSSYLDGKCGSDIDLRREIESLIAAHAATEHLESPAAAMIAAAISNDATNEIAGKTLGHYQVIEKIGSGGMGEVYAARDTRLGRKVALKLLPSYFTQDTERVRRFQQEARAASALNHPNIVTIYEIGQVDSTHYIATELIEGETLRTHIGRGPAKIIEAIDLAVQVASALDVAHEARIVHRDIKPENIMLRADRIVKVLDFGLAKLTERPGIESEASTMLRTDEGIVMGTAQYMSPEQARGLRIDARTDIWSLGCVLYELLAGRAAFESPTTGDIIVSILEREPPPLARFVSDVPLELDWIVKKALRKDRGERYQTGKEMLSDLRALRHRIEFESELERTSSPEREIVRRSDEHVVTDTAPASAAHPTSSAEYLVGEIKNHKRSALLILAAFAVAVAAAGYYYFLQEGRAAIDSMVVLPFVNAGSDSDPDPDTEYLSDGLTESLINSLSQLPNLRMIARTSAQRYKGREVDPQTVARELGVHAVVTGRVIRRGDRLLISAELVDARDNSHIWGEQYNKRPSDILLVQQEIAREIADKLRTHLTGEQQHRVTRNYTENVEAYQLYLRGRHHWNKRTGEGLRQAVEYFQQAIDRDPNYALAYSGLADSYSNLEEYVGAPANEMLPLARAAALRALEIDPSLAEAQASLGLNYRKSWQWAEAEREFKRAIELNPNYASAHQWYGLWLEVMGRSDEALMELKLAQEVDPLSPIINTNLARNYFLRGDLDAAISECRKVIELNPTFPQSHVILALVYLDQERYDEAITELRKGVDLSGRGSLPLAALGYGYALTGNRSEAEMILKELADKYDRQEAGGGSIAWIYAGLGDKERAFDALEREFQERGGSLPNTILFYPYLNTLRDDPRYPDVVRRMGLPNR